MSTAVTQEELHTALVDVAEGAADGLHEATQALDVTREPGLAQDRAFTLTLQVTDPRKYRSQPGRRDRKDVSALLLVAYRLDPRDQRATTVQSYKDEEAVVAAWNTRNRDPLLYSRPVHVSTTRTLHPLGEWLFISVLFSMALDWSLPGVTP